MKLSSPPFVTEPFPCPYLPELEAQYLIFNVHELKREIIDELLSLGLRRFGAQLFRPECLTCRACLPLRVDVSSFKFSSSQKRVWNKNRDLTSSIELVREYDPAIYALYRLHNRRFTSDQETMSEEEFIHVHFTSDPNPGPILRLELDGELIAAGLLELGVRSLSSQYFVFDPAHARRSLGILGALHELHWAQQQGLEWYYLGYWIKDNTSMNYKNRFHPYQLFDWTQQLWLTPPSP
jgi:leucyl-tRNA---protein transferase